jgi:hypothetical protein
LHFAPLNKSTKPIFPSNGVRPVKTGSSRLHTIKCLSKINTS